LGGSFNLSIDSLANAISIWTKAVSLSQVFSHPFYQSTQSQSACPQSRAIRHYRPIQKMTVLPIPGRKRHRINSRRRDSRKTNPTSKVTRITSKPAVLKHKYVDFQLKLSTSDNLPSSFRPVLAWSKKKETIRRKAINACYQSATLPTPSSPSNSHRWVLRCIQQGPVS